MTSAILITGGGIVYDSDPYDEYIETLNKLKSNITTIQRAEEMYARMQANGGKSDMVINREEPQEPPPDAKVGKGI